ncbi:hypothetical protein ABZX85_32720 [Streptomyces sp. NPDC004539]|uniref:DUF6891 domain-containing protein n=1 Tax=Streptomyces sp. NPDC004539 TaxID=3154280 RepID=UPI00339E890A
MENHGGKGGAGGLSVKVESEAGETVLWPSPERLRELVGRIGAEGDRWLVVQRVPDLPDVFAQVWHRTGEEYRFEHRASRAEFFGTEAWEPEAVADALVGWAAGAAGWESGFDWSRVDADPPQDVRALPDDVRVQVEEIVGLTLRCGYADRAMLAETARECLRDGGESPVSRAQARELVDRLWLERVREQEAWEGVTDPERVTLAFGALTETGITARENFACCRNCADTEIGGEAAEEDRGFVYFHSQCAEGAAQGHGLMLLYGGFDGSVETTAAVGREVVSALAGAGLSTEWDGDPSRAIVVTGLDWRKRLVG